MARKQEDAIVGLSKTLQDLFSDPIGNYDELCKAVGEQQEAVIAIREAAQSHLSWLSALRFALQANKIESLVRKAKENEA